MASWSTTFDQVVDDIIVLFRNTTGRNNPTFRERQMMERSVNEAMQRVCLRKYGTRLRCLETEVSKTTTSGTDYIDIGPDVLHILQGTVVISDEDLILTEAAAEQMEQFHAVSDLTGTPEIYSFEASDSGANYIRMKLYPTPDATYTIAMKGSKIVSEDGIEEFPNYMTGAITDLSTAIAMKRIGFGAPTPYRVDAEMALEEVAAQEASDSPMHVPRSTTTYRSSRLQSRAN